MTKSKSKKPTEILNNEKRLLPQFGSMAHCAGATGIPLEALKLAKSGGCDAFKHGNRVDLGLFLRWWFAQPDAGAQVDKETGMAWDKALDREKALRERIKRIQDEGKTVDRAEIIFAWNKAMAMATELMDKRCRVTLPPILNGRDANFIEAELVKLQEDFFSKLRDGLTQLSK